MKISNKTLGAAITALISTGLLAFTSLTGGAIKGTVTPAESAVSVMAITGTDTLTAPIVGGNFEIVNAKAGTYFVAIVAQPPYKNVIKEGVVLSEEQSLDLGTIILEK